MTTHQTRPMMSHDIRLLSIHNFIKLLYYMVSQPWENTKLMSKFAMVLTYEWDPKMVIYSL